MAHFRFPKPDDWNRFEEIVCDVFSRKFDAHNLQRYARSGQKQYGVDIVGMTTIGLLGIQCKHHSDTIIKTAEIDEAITLAESFTPPLHELYIVTSSARDNVATSHVLRISGDRQAQKKYPVTIKFWEDVVDWLVDFPDLIYKHFSKFFPKDELEHLYLPHLGKCLKHTLTWPVGVDDLKTAVAQTIGGVERVDPYQLTVGLSSFPDVSFEGLVDIEASLAEHVSDELAAETGFKEAGQTLTDIRALIRPPFFAREMVVYLQTRLTLAFLAGWMFRKVSGLELQIVFRDQVWATSGLPLVLTGLTDGLPELINQENDEVVLVLNISRSIETSVFDFVGSWEVLPKAILISNLPGQAVTSAAHALSISLEISQKIKTLVDTWRVSKIHLFGALPAALATLIGFHLNAICPISIYFRDREREKYIMGGTLTNNL